MSYAICRMQKMKSHDLKGMQFHNQRERESKTNPDIEKSKLHLNYDLANENPIDYNKRVKEIIDSQRTSERKVRKDAVLVNELVITSDRDFFDGLSENEQKQFFEESYKLFSDRYGEQNIAYAMVHNDEKTPHLHMGVVPMRDGKLQGKNVFNRNELRWIQDKFPEHMKSKGFDIQRGEKGSDREHLTTQQFKSQTLKQQIVGLETDLALKQSEKEKVEESIQDIQGKLKELQESIDYSKHIDLVPFKEKGLMGRKTIQLDRSDFENMKNLAKTSQSHESENKALKQENKKLVKENFKLKEENRNVKDERWELKQENKMLQRTLEKAKILFKNNIPELAMKIGLIKATVIDKMGLGMNKAYFSDPEEIKGAKHFLSEKEKEKQNENEHEL